MFDSSKNNREAVLKRRRKRESMDIPTSIIQRSIEGSLRVEKVVGSENVLVSPPIKISDCVVARNRAFDILRSITDAEVGVITICSPKTESGLSYRFQLMGDGTIEKIS